MAIEPIDGGADAPAEDDLRATIAAAVRGDAPAPDAPAAPAAAAADTPAAPEAAPAAGEPAKGPARDPAGKFAKPAEGEQTPLTAQPEPGSAEAKEPIRPPAAWSPAAKAKFATLDPEIQAEIGKREADIAKGLQTRSEQLKRYEPLEQIVAPQRQSWMAKGFTSDAQAIGFLVAAQKSLDDNPVQGIISLAKSYGIEPHQLLNTGQQAQPPAPDGQAQAPHPDIQRLTQQLSTLSETVAQQSARESQQLQATHLSEIQKFAADPANLYFENVKADMATLLDAGIPGDTLAEQLANAYDRVIWARPDIRSLLLAEQARTGQVAETAAARAKVAEAQRAAGSVTGAPGPGSSPAAAAPSTDLRETIRAAIRA
jgi:hypothetical protein